jgi:hypothetical protein
LRPTATARHKALRAKSDASDLNRLALVALATRWEASAQTARRLYRTPDGDAYLWQAQMWEECAAQLRQLLESR